MKALARVTQEGGLWWASYQRDGLRIKLPFRKRIEAVHWVVLRGFRVDWGYRLRPEDAFARKTA